MKRIRQCGLLALAVLIFFLSSNGCTNRHYRKSADRGAYAAIRQKTPLVTNMDEHFTIEQTNQPGISGLPLKTGMDEFLGQEGAAERGAPVFSLERALEIAVNYNRAYQLQKEQLYLSALALTLARHQFAPIFSARASGLYSVTTVDVVDYIPDPNDPSRQIPVIGKQLAETRTATANGQAIGSLLLATGARLTASFTTDFLRYLTGDPSAQTTSHLLGQVIQPLWRGGGYKVNMENLTQSERNLLYALRDFTRYRKDFAVQSASAYYLVLQNRDAVRNNYANLQASRKNAERTRELAREGRVAQADLGRLEQQELSVESQWIGALNNYKQALDNFKIQLGLTTDSNIVLDDRELEQLQIFHPEISVEDSIKVALATRLDYQNFRDRFEDAERKIGVAANALRAQVDLVAAAGIDSPQEQATRFAVPQIDRYHWNAGLNVDLPLERTVERNAYRTALIGREQARRAYEGEEDTIKLQVRDSWRTLDQAKRNFEISELGVKIAERRVEEQNLLAELGRARAQDQVDAENDLANSRNQRTQALVSHTVARLQFWDNLGILYIKDNGQWKEIADARSQ